MKIVYILLAIVALAVVVLAVTNPSETDVYARIEAAKSTKVDEWYLMQMDRKAEAKSIGKSLYYLPVFEVKRNNYLIFSTYDVTSGWTGTMNRAGIPVSKSKIKGEFKDKGVEHFESKTHYQIKGFFNNLTVEKTGQFTNFDTN